MIKRTTENFIKAAFLFGFLLLRLVSETEVFCHIFTFLAAYMALSILIGFNPLKPIYRNVKA